jgi:hypothetical protein
MPIVQDDKPDRLRGQVFLRLHGSPAIYALAGLCPTLYRHAKLVGSTPYRQGSLR